MARMKVSEMAEKYGRHLRWRFEPANATAKVAHIFPPLTTTFNLPKSSLIRAAETAAQGETTTLPSHKPLGLRGPE
jgi:hypothetical protein